MKKLIIFAILLFSLQLSAQVRSTAQVGVTTTSVSTERGITIQAGKPPVFNFTLPPSSGQTTHKLKIVEILGDQSPEAALRTNKPIFEKDSLKELSFRYPDRAPGFTPGKKYAWAIQTLNKDKKGVGQNDGYAKATQFTVGASAIDPKKR